MTITKCSNNHIYDSDIYHSCPYCNNGVQVPLIRPREVVFGQSGADSNSVKIQLRTSSTGENDDAARTQPLDMTAPPSRAFDETGRTQPLDMTAPPSRAFDEIGRTQPLDMTAPPLRAFDDAVRTQPLDMHTTSAGPTDVFGKTEPVGARTSYPDPFDAPGKTMPVARLKVVGWLVCIDGMMEGKSFNLYNKQNTVGSGSLTDIRLEGDATISEKHALIAYDPRHNRFTLVPKTEAELMSLNGENVGKATRLTSFDRIKMGKSNFIFVALCGDNFKWESSESGSLLR